MIKFTISILVAMAMNTASAGSSEATTFYDCMAPGLERIYSLAIDSQHKTVAVVLEDGGGPVTLKRPHLDSDLDEDGRIVAHIVTWQETELNPASGIEPSQTLVVETGGYYGYKKANIGQTKMICVLIK